LNELFSLQGRIALITGGSRGIGRMIAAGFLRQGAKVYISSRKAAACDTAAADLSALGPCMSLPADVSTVEGARELATQFSNRESSLDILVHNAGTVWNENFDAFRESGWDKVLNVNLKTPFFLTQIMHPLLAKSGKQQCAKVISIASIDGLSVNPLETYSYSASKAGLIHLTRRMALTLIKDNIVASCIAPGAFASDMNTEARDHADELAQRIPAGRIGRDDDIAAAAVYLASRAGDYLVGETLVVDGGWSHARG
jgi:NAD(P)-dependent dehydrogenase (short-subunit alcohol dehydrogenase family)